MRTPPPSGQAMEGRSLTAASETLLFSDTRHRQRITSNYTFTFVQKRPEGRINNNDYDESISRNFDRNLEQHRIIHDIIKSYPSPDAGGWSLSESRRFVTALTAFLL